MNRRTIERSRILANGNNGSYFQTFESAVSREVDVKRVLERTIPRHSQR